MSFRLSLPIGTTKLLSATSCNSIQQQVSTDCNASVTNGLYWVQGMKVRTYVYGTNAIYVV